MLRSFSWSVLISLALAGCGDSGTADAGGGLDAGATADAGGGGSDASSDAGGGDDAGATDAGASDAGASDAGTADAGAPDAGAPDAGPPPDAGPTCSYIDLDIWIADCTGGPTYVRRWNDLDGRCPDYFTVGPTRYSTLMDALSMNGCDADCLRRAATSVSLLRCGRRTGYISFEDPEMDCDPLLETPDGLYGSVEEWNAAHPCP